jgi:predicted PolB exonuclease-like 3'-5' exonuclease
MALECRVVDFCMGIPGLYLGEDGRLVWVAYHNVTHFTKSKKNQEPLETYVRVCIGHEDSVGLSVCEVHISDTRWHFYEVTECDQTESDKSRHYAILESDKTLFGMR